MKYLILFSSFFLSASCIPPTSHSPRAKKHINLGTKALNQGLTDIAEAHYKLAIDIEPRNAEAFNGLGLISLIKQNLKRAEIMFSQSIAYDPEFVEALNNLGVVMQKQCFFKKAEKLFKKALGINPDYVDARYNLAMLQLRNGKLHKAEINFLKLFALTSRHKYYIYLAYAEILNKKKKSSFKHLQKGLKHLKNQNKAQAWIYLLLGINELNESKPERAVLFFRKSLNSDNNFKEAWFQLAKAYFLIKQFENAKIAILKAYANRSEQYKKLFAVRFLKKLQKKYEVKFR